MVAGTRADSLERDGLGIPSFAGRSDYAECRRLHRMHGKTYYFASRRFRPSIRRQVDALYGFVRVPDEWVDQPRVMSSDHAGRLISQWRKELLNGLEGVRPAHPAMRAFCDTMRESQIPVEEPLLFLKAMEQDLSVQRYPTYDALREYMRGSAASVGVMMCCILGAPQEEAVHRAAAALGEAMQLTNFLRDIREDAEMGRIYIPQEDLQLFRVDERQILGGVYSDRFASLMRFEIARARALYEVADPGIELLPRESRAAVRVARVLYSRVLDRIEERDGNVFAGRVGTSYAEKLLVGLNVLFSR